MKKAYLLFTIVVLCAFFGAFFSLNKFDPKPAKASIYNPNSDTLNQLNSDINLSSSIRNSSLVPDEYIIKFKSGNKPQNLKNSQNESLSIKNDLNNDTYLLENPKNTIKNNSLSELIKPTNIDKTELENETKITKDTIKELEKKPEIESVEPNTIVKINFTPDDTLFSSQWHLKNTGQTGGSANSDIKAPQAWDITQGSSSVIIAVIDTGVDLTHPDLVDKIAKNTSNQVIGYDFANNNSNPTDTQGHGTHLAGIIAGKTNNTQGISGVCPNCKIMPIKFMDNTGTGTTAAGISAINYAVTNGAKVINLSWGSNGYSPALQNAINNAYNNNVLVVASAGNDNVRDLNFPADMSHVISVAATDNSDHRAFYSNFSDRVTVSAPGNQILSTLPSGVNLSSICGDSSFPPNNDGYGYCSGTSMAAPVVSGIAGLVIGQNPTFNSDQIAGQIMNTTDNIDNINPSFKGLLGSGRVNAFRALTETAKPNFSYAGLSLSDPNGNNNYIAEASEDVNLRVKLQNNWINATNVTATLSTTDSQVSVTQNTSNIGNIDFTLIQNGNFTIHFDPNTQFPKTVDFALNVNSSGFPNQLLNFSYTFKAPKTIPSQWNFSDGEQDWQSASLWHLSDSCFTGTNQGSPKYFHFGKDLCGDYDFNLRMVGALYSPAIQGKNNQQLSLSFDQFLETENQPNLYDKATVKIKSYGAADSTAITLVSPQNNTTGWQNKKIDLPLSLTNNSIFQIIFDFDSIDTGNNNLKGWFIDNVSITTNELTASDLSNLVLNCPDSDYATTSNCTFSLPSNKSLPTDFKLKINQNNLSPNCTLVANSTGQVLCDSIPNPNSIGVFPIQIVLNGTTYPSNTQIKIKGQDFSKANFTFNNNSNPNTSLLFKSIDVLPVKISSYKNVFDLNPVNNSYNCSFELAPLGSSNDSNYNSWINFGANVPYDNSAGCQANITKSQRGNRLGFDVRVKICTIATNPSCSTFIDQYIFRFEGSGIAIGV